MSNAPYGIPANPFRPVSKATNAYELLDEIRELIIEEPLRYNQASWLSIGEDAHRIYEVVPSCGTVGCVAGWVVALRGYVGASSVYKSAMYHLGIDYEKADILFHGDAAGCVDEIGGGVDSQTPEHARLGALHISQFMEQNKEKLLAHKLGDPYNPKGE